MPFIVSCFASPCRRRCSAETRNLLLCFGSHTRSTSPSKPIRSQTFQQTLQRHFSSSPTTSSATSTAAAQIRPTPPSKLFCSPSIVKSIGQKSIFPRSSSTMADALHSRPAAAASERLADALEKPLLDNRTYRVIKLHNDLEALLVHDPDTDKASAAMDVNVGAYADDEDMPGIAHAVEHLLFMGTKKYPGENEYSSYLSKYGGYSNAFTAATSTNYYFELSASSTSNSPASSTANSTANSRESLLTPVSKAKNPLYGALDRFSQFFVHPLFSEDTLDRELRAVDSENKKNLQSDMWRLYQLNKSTSSFEHPFHKFSTGNYKLLHDDPIERGVKIRDEFINFYQKHYSANRMKLVVLGRESLDELQTWVEEFFSDVPNQNLKQLRWDDIPIYTEEHLCTQIFAKPVMEQRKLDLYFLYPDEDELYDAKPSHYISHLIGHEGPGSVLALLKAKGWANSLSSGGGSHCPGSATFHIDVTLTEEGLKKYQEVVKIIFEYIAILKDQPPQQWINDEISKLAEVQFRFKQKSPASSTTSGLAGVMQRPYPRDQLLSAQSLVTRFDPEAIKRGLSHLVPDNFRLTLISQDFPGDWDKKEKWYGTEYRIEKFPASFLESLWSAHKSSPKERSPELYLPTPNEFLPERLDVEKKNDIEPTTSPKLVRNDGNVRTWFKKDDRFWVPKANINVCLRTPLVNATPLTFVTMKMYTELVEDALSEYAYDAELAGLNYDLDKSSRGLEVAISGFSDKMHVLLQKVLVSMRDLEVNQDRFDVIKERVLRSYRNFEYNEPYRQISTYSRWIMAERGWSHQQLMEALPSVTAQDVREFFPQILRQVHIEVLVHGNLHKEDALRASDLVEKTLKPKHLPSTEWPTTRSIMLPTGSNLRYEKKIKNPDNVNHCLEYNLFMGEKKSRPLVAKLLLLAQMMREPVFDTLRTKEQLGYIVSSYPIAATTYLAMRILIQSEKDCSFLETRTDAFLKDFEKVIEKMTDSEFDEYKISVINARLEKLKNLNQESSRFWHHISTEEFDFDQSFRDVENLELLSKEDTLDFYRTYMLPGSTTRVKATVHLIAAVSPEDIAASMSPAERKDKLSSKISELLAGNGLSAESAEIGEHIDEKDVSEGNIDQIMSNVASYLQDAKALTEEQFQQVVISGKTALAGVLPSLGIITHSEEDTARGNNDDATQEKSSVTIIEDVKAFKASLPLSAGPLPVTPLCEFEELESKL